MRRGSTGAESRELIAFGSLVSILIIVALGAGRPTHRLQLETQPAVKIARVVDPVDGIDVKVDGPVGNVLAGSFVVPVGASESHRVPAVVFITGSGLQDRDETIFGKKPFRVLAAALYEAGIASIRCDDRGVGGSTGNPSLATTHDFLADALAQVKWLRTRPEIDPNRVGIIGHSEGGLIGTLLAKGPSAPIDFAVLLAPPALSGLEIMVGQSQDIYSKMGVEPADAAFALECHREMLDAVIAGAEDAVLRESMKRLVEAQLACLMKTKPSEALIEQSVTQGMAQVGSPWMKVFLALDPDPAIRALSVPTLVLFGERDLQVSPKRNAGAFQRAASQYPVAPKVTIVPSANHLFQPAKTGMMDEYALIPVDMDPEVPPMIAKWIVTLFDKGNIADPSGVREPAKSDAPLSPKPTDPASPKSSP